MIEKLEQMEELKQLEIYEQVELGNLRYKIKEIYWSEDIMWRQRVRYKYLKERDANTVFFHKLASVHKRLNTIHVLSSKGRMI